MGIWKHIRAIIVLPVMGIIGKGTLAPWNPTQKLVVQGVYRHVRNPMISGVCFFLLGEAMVAASWPLLSWFIVFALGNVMWIAGGHLSVCPAHGHAEEL